MSRAVMTLRAWVYRELPGSGWLEAHADFLSKNCSPCCRLKDASHASVEDSIEVVNSGTKTLRLCVGAQ